MKTSARLGLTLLLFSFTATLLPAGDGKAFAGWFDGKSFDPAMKMTWIIGRDLKTGATTISVVVPITPPKDKKVKGKQNAGQASGTNIKLQGDKLEFELEWSQNYKVKGPANAKYVAEIKGNDLLVKWSAGDEKGELSATNRAPIVVAKKEDKKEEKKVEVKKEDKKDEKPKAAGQKVYLSGLITDKGIPAQKGTTVKQLGLVIVMGKGSKAQNVEVTKDTKFVVVDGDDKKTFDHKSVVNDADIHAAFSERFVTLERQGPIALVVTATAPKKK